MSRYDVLIIGAGPIGLACGIEAKKAGLEYLIIEKGCLVNSLFHYPVTMTFFSTAERLEIGGIPFMTLNKKPNRAEAVEYYRRVTQYFNLNVQLFEAFKSIQRLSGEFLVTTSKQEYQTRHIIVCTGFYDIPVMLDVPGENLPKVTHYYQDPHYYSFQKVLVVGASNSAVDVALETWRKGADVTMVIKGADIGKNVKYWVRPDILNRIKEGSIRAFFGSVVSCITERDVSIRTPEGIHKVENDFVLAMTGYQPDFKLLESMGIKFSDDKKKIPVFHPGNMETNQKGIFLAGVVCGGLDTHQLFIENSREHAEKIFQYLKSTR